MRCETGGPARRDHLTGLRRGDSRGFLQVVRVVRFRAVAPRSAPASIADQGRAEDLRVAMTEGARRGPYRSRSRRPPARAARRGRPRSR
jgi:hypothetical protein